MVYGGMCGMVAFLIYTRAWKDYGSPKSYSFTACVQCPCRANGPRVPNSAPESVYIPEADIQYMDDLKRHVKLHLKDVWACKVAMLKT